MRMHSDFIDDLLNSLNRVLVPDKAPLREILIIGGMPRSGQNLRYQSYNRQIVREAERTLEFSLVAVINNRRIAHWRLTGYRRQISQFVFHARWTRNPLDLFLNAVRCDTRLMDILEAAAFDYTILGLLQIEETQDSRLLNRKRRHIRPVLAAPGLPEEALTEIASFERSHEIRNTKIRAIPLIG